MATEKHPHGAPKAQGKIEADGTWPSWIWDLHVGLGGTRRGMPCAGEAAKTLSLLHHSRASSHRLVPAWTEHPHGGA